MENKNCSGILLVKNKKERCAKSTKNNNYVLLKCNTSDPKKRAIQNNQINVFFNSVSRWVALVAADKDRTLFFFFHRPSRASNCYNLQQPLKTELIDLSKFNLINFILSSSNNACLFWFYDQLFVNWRSFNVNIKLISVWCWPVLSTNKWTDETTFQNSCSLNFSPGAFPRKGIWQVLFLTSPKSLNDNFLLIWIREQISSSSAGEEKTAFGKKLAVIFRQRAILSFLAWTRTGETLLRRRRRRRRGHGRWSHGVKRLILAVNLMRRSFWLFKAEEEEEDDLMGWPERRTDSLHVSPIYFRVFKIDPKQKCNM